MYSLKGCVRGGRGSAHRPFHHSVGCHVGDGQLKLSKRTPTGAGRGITTTHVTHQQDEKHLDENGREIVPGVPLPLEALAAAQKEEADAEGLLLTQLIAKADTLPFNVLLAGGRTVLGPTCPRSKEQFLAQSGWRPGSGPTNACQKSGRRPPPKSS
jgi:hypothetical protein